MFIRSGKWMLGGGGCLLLIIAIIVIPVMLGSTNISNFFDSIRQFLGWDSPVAQVTPTRTLLEDIMGRGQLVSVSVQLAKADIEVGVRSGALNACGFSTNHVAQAEINAGIDLNQLTEEDIFFDDERDIYSITLPSAQLTSCSIEISQYDRSTTLCNIDWDEARQLANRVAMESFRSDAVESGILDRAEQEAQRVFGSLVKALTGKDAEITFRQADEAFIPDSCQPQLPAGWTQNEAEGFWTKTG